MSNPTDVKLMKWPFFVGDAVLLAFAYFIYERHQGSLGHVEAVLFLGAGALGAVLAVTPYLVEYFAAVKMVETGAVVSTINQIQNLDVLAAQISGATAQWQGVQEHAARANITAQEISERMTAETAAFTDFSRKPTTASGHVAVAGKLRRGRRRMAASRRPPAGSHLMLCTRRAVAFLASPP